MEKDAESAGRPSESSAELLGRVRAGSRRALSALFRREGRTLNRWARGRLPRWARRFADTADIVQDALMQTFRQIDRFQDRGKGALQAYLRRAVVNRINDEIRRVGRHPLDDLDEAPDDRPADAPTPFDTLLTVEEERRYKEALTTLTEDERILVVGRLELGFNYEQLALISSRSTSEAARLAVRRAVIKVARKMASV